MQQSARVNRVCVCDTIVSVAGTVSEKQTDCCLAHRNKDNVCIITVRKVEQADHHGRFKLEDFI